MDSEIKRLLKNYITARIDIKNFGEPHNYVKIIENSDSDSYITQPRWFENEEGRGIVIHSSKCSINLKIECINEGILRLYLKGKDIYDKNSNRFPIYIDYTSLKINNEEIIHENKLVWHDSPYIFEKNVTDHEEINISLKWAPFSHSSEYLPESHNDKIDAVISNLKRVVNLREKQITSLPQLCGTTVGKKAFNGKLVYRNWLWIYGGPSEARNLMKDIGGFCENIWFTRFLKNRFMDEDFKINMFGIFQKHHNLKYPMDGKKVIYTSEDLNYRFLEMKREFDKYAFDYVDFAMGFDLIDHPKYLRFPLWIIYHFSPEMTDEEIEDKVNLWNSMEYEKTENVAAIASHDRWKTRTIIADDISDYVNITYAGRWRNNTSELWDTFNNNKQKFLSRYKFNICAENLVDDGYVTEKIFDAINSNCIPLYAGSQNYMEPEVLNENAILRWYVDDNINHYKLKLDEHQYEYNFNFIAEENRNQDSVELFNNLLTDEKTYKEFRDQNILIDSSAKHIIKKYSDLEKHFERLIYDE